MSRLARLIAVACAFLCMPAFAGSTIDPNVPAQNAPLSSAPVRSNFFRAKTDIDNILGMFAGTIAPVAPSVGQFWRDTSTNPQPIRQWDGTQWVTWGTLNTASHTFTPSGGGNLITAVNSNFAVSSGTLAFSSILAGNLLANCGASTAEPTSCPTSALFDRNFTSTPAASIYRDATGWKGAGPGLIKPVSITEYGAIPADSTKGAINAAAFVNAFNAGVSVYCPSGVTFYVDTINVPAPAREVKGRCTLIPAPTMVQGGAVLAITAGVFSVEEVAIAAMVQNINTTCTTSVGSAVLTSCASTAGAIAGNVINVNGVPSGTTVVSKTSNTITMSVVASCNQPNQPACGAQATTVSQAYDAIQVGGGSVYVTIRNTAMNGRHCIYSANSSYITVQNVKCVAYLVRGFDNFAGAGNSSFVYTGNDVRGGLPGSAHAYTFEGGSGYTITGNVCEAAQYFCYSLSGLSNALTNFTLTGNISKNSVHECINFEAVSSGTISGNTCTFDATSTDYGLSGYANSGFTIRDVTISGNQLINPGGSGIGVSTFGGGTAADITITGNTVKSPNAQNKDPNGACIELVAVGTQFVKAYGNTCHDTVGNMKWLGLEFASGGNPNNNDIGPNYGPGGTLGINSMLGAASNGFALGPIYGAFYKAANQSYTASALAKFNLDTAQSNKGLLFDGVTNHRVTVPATGAYRIGATAYFLSTTALSEITMLVTVNGSGLVEQDGQSSINGNSQTLSVSRLYKMNAGDYVELFVSSSVNQTLVGGTSATVLDINYVGP